MREAVDCALGMIDTHLQKGHEIPVNPKRETTFAPFGPDGSIASVSSYYVLERNHEALFSAVYQDVMSTPEAGDLLEYVSSSPAASTLLCDAGGNRIRDPKDAKNWLVSRCLRPIVVRCLRDNVRRPVSRDYLDDLLGQLENYVASDSFLVTFWTPLANFESTIARADISDVLILRELTEQERIQLWTGSEEGMVDRWDVLRVRFALETTYAVPKFGGVDESDAAQQFERCVAAMRLVKAGAVASYVTIHRESESTPFFGASGSSARAAPRGPGPRYRLDATDVDSVKALYSGLTAKPLRGDVGLAIERFNDGTERQRYEDRLIDYWIALEALFSPSDRLELRYRLRLRTAYFLERDPGGRERIYDELGDSYDARSAVVHGRKPEVDLRTVCDQTEEIVRSTLRRIVMSDEPFDGEHLDSMIARGEPT